MCVLRVFVVFFFFFLPHFFFPPRFSSLSFFLSAGVLGILVSAGARGWLGGHLGPPPVRGRQQRGRGAADGGRVCGGNGKPPGCLPPSHWQFFLGVLHSGSLAESASQPAREMSGGISQPAKEMPGGISQATKTAESASQPRRCPAESASQPRRCPAESASQPRRCPAEAASQGDTRRNQPASSGDER